MVLGMNQYEKVDKVLKSYENYKPYHGPGIYWACDRIAWLAQWKKLPKDQIDELANRATAILKEDC